MKISPENIKPDALIIGFHFKKKIWCKDFWYNVEVYDHYVPYSKDLEWIIGTKTTCAKLKKYLKNNE